MANPDEIKITELRIRQVANGWEVVSDGDYYSRRNQEIGPDKTWVFSDVTRMTDWMLNALKEPEAK